LFDTVAWLIGVLAVRFMVYASVRSWVWIGFASVEVTPSPDCHHRRYGAGGRSALEYFRSACEDLKWLNRGFFLSFR